MSYNGIVKNRSLSKKVYVHEFVKKCLVITAFAGVIVLPRTAYSGVCAGLKLWAQVVLPALFPALVITSCILRLFRMKKSMSYLYIILTGILCGFPVGASLCSEFHMREPDEKVCEPLSAFCNISSPSFVINYIIYANMKECYPVWVILACIYLPVLECLIALMIRYRRIIFLHDADSKERGKHIKGKDYAKLEKHGTRENYIKQEKSSERVFDILDAAIWKSIKSVLKLGGYIVVFSCIASYLSLLPLPEPVKGVLCGITEITNGIYLCAAAGMTAPVTLFIITALNAFGGISTLMQTAGLTDDQFFQAKKYTYNKCLLTAVTMINTAFIICIF